MHMLQVWQLEVGTRFRLCGDNRIFVLCGRDDYDSCVFFARELGCRAITRIDGDCDCHLVA